MVTSLLHTNVKLEDEGAKQLLALLDGTRNRAALCDQTGATAAELEDGLTALARLGLISA